jgi:hypothetical protein
MTEIRYHILEDFSTETHDIFGMVMGFLNQVRHFVDDQFLNRSLGCGDKVL